MPTISMFYGIVVRMQSEKGGKHHKPHIHCIYGDDEIVVALDGEVMEGSVPSSKLKLIEAWITIHQEDLMANWKLLNDGDGYFKIDPLR